MHVAVLSLIRHDFARGLPLLFCRRLVAWFLCRVMRRCCWTFCLRYLQRIIIIIRGASVRVSNETNERRNFLEEERKEREKIFFFFWWERFCLQGKFFNISFLWKKKKKKEENGFMGRGLILWWWFGSSLVAEVREEEISMHGKDLQTFHRR